MRDLLTQLERRLRHIAAVMPPERDYEAAGAAISLGERRGATSYLRAIRTAVDEARRAGDRRVITIAGVNGQTWHLWLEQRRWRAERQGGGPTFTFASIDVPDVAASMHSLDADEPNRPRN